MNCRSKSNFGKSTLIQIVPCRTVEPNGVADYSLVLARELRARGGIEPFF